MAWRRPYFFGRFHVQMLSFLIYIEYILNIKIGILFSQRQHLNVNNNNKSVIQQNNYSSYKWDEVN